MELPLLAPARCRATQGLPKLPTLALAVVLGASLAGCLPENQVVLDVGQAPTQMTVEAYLMPDSVPRVAIGQTLPYFSTLGGEQGLALLTTLASATVVLEHRGQRDTLTYHPPEFNTQPGTGANWFVGGEYRSTNRVPRHFNEPFTLTVLGSVLEADGQRTLVTATAQTYLPAPLELDTIFAERNPENPSTWRLEGRWPDPDPQALNSYRFLADKGEADSLARAIFNDVVLTSRFNVALTDYRFRPQDTVRFRLYHIPEAYYWFLSSVFSADLANQIPFAAPEPIVGNVDGALGIFTGLYPIDTAFTYADSRLPTPGTN